MSKIPVNKKDIIEAIHKAVNIPKNSAALALDTVLASIVNALRSGNSVSLIGFGTFSIKFRNARKGRNPQTGEPIDIKAVNMPAFKAGKDLKAAVQGDKVVLEEEVE